MLKHGGSSKFLNPFHITEPTSVKTPSNSENFQKTLTGDYLVEQFFEDPFETPLLTINFLNYIIFIYKCLMIFVIPSFGFPPLFPIAIYFDFG